MSDCSNIFYILLTKNRHILNIRMLRQNVSKIRQEKKIEIISSLYVLNCFEYFEANCFKNSQRF